MEEIKVTYTEEEARALLRFIPLFSINFLLFPEKYKGDHDTEVLKSAFEKIDYQIHEVNKICDKPDCPYWKIKAAKEKAAKKKN